MLLDYFFDNNSYRLCDLQLKIKVRKRTKKAAKWISKYYYQQLLSKVNNFSNIDKKIEISIINKGVKKTDKFSI